MAHTETGSVADVEAVAAPLRPAVTRLREASLAVDASAPARRAKSILDALAAGCRALAADLRHREGSDADAWERVGASLEHLASAVTPAVPDTEPPPWAGFHHAAAQVLESVPETLTLPLRRADLEPDETDDLRTALWKRAQRLRHRRGKEPTPPDAVVRQREIPARALLEHRAVLPFARELFEAWKLAHHGAASEMARARTEVAALLQVLVSAETFDTLIRDPVASDFAERLETLAGALEGRAAPEVLGSTGPDDVVQRFAHASGLAGTGAVPARAFDIGHSTAAWALLETEHQRALAAWARHHEESRKDWERTIELLLLQVRSAKAYAETVSAAEERIAAHVRPALESVLGVVAASHDAHAGDASPDTDLATRIQAENRTLVRALRREHLPKLMDTIDEARVEKNLENFLSRVRRHVSQLPESHAVLQDPGLDHVVPETRSVRIDLKDIVQFDVFQALARAHEALIADVHEKIAEILRSVSEFDQLVEVNLAAALHLITENREPDALGQARAAVIEGLARARSHLDETTRNTEALHTESMAKLHEMTEAYQAQLDAFTGERVIDLQLRRAKARAREEVAGAGGRVRAWMGRTFPVVFSVTRRAGERVRAVYRRVRRLSGLTVGDAELPGRLSDFIAKTEAQIAQLPYVYQRLFGLTPLEDERNAVLRSGELERLRARFEAWQEGHHGAAAVVGEKGSGRTTLLNLAQPRIFNRLSTQRIDCSVDKFASLDRLTKLLVDQLSQTGARNLGDLEREIVERSDRSVVVLEDVQNLFLRTVDGLAAIERFLLFMARTDERIFWVVSCTRYSWAFLDHVMQISRHFWDVIDVGGLSREDIEELIMKRHRVSGYRLVFDPPEALGQSRRYRNATTDEERQTILREEFFTKLHGLADGNVSVAIMLWLGGIRDIAGGTLTIDPALELDDAFIERLPSEELLTFVALLQHERLDTEEHAAIFRLGLDRSRVLLARMEKRGLLVSDEDARWRINQVLYRLVVRVARRRNFIH